MRLNDRKVFKGPSRRTHLRFALRVPVIAARRRVATPLFNRVLAAEFPLKGTTAVN